MSKNSRKREAEVFKLVHTTLASTLHQQRDQSAALERENQRLRIELAAAQTPPAAPAPEPVVAPPAPAPAPVPATPLEALGMRYSDGLRAIARPTTANALAEHMARRDAALERTRPAS
jgi:hypothetical protein